MTQPTVWLRNSDNENGTSVILHFPSGAYDLVVLSFDCKFFQSDLAPVKDDGDTPARA